VVKAYSPPIDPHLLPPDGSPPKPPMLDAAIIKIDATNLPVVPLARNVEQVYLGQELVTIGYPGVVLWNDFLSRRSRAEASVTFGRVSSFKLDVNERIILQTDAPITWGNSGGPAFDLNGDVIGVATFISTSLEGDQAIQGFNFLIPVDTIQAMARQIGLTPKADSPFMTEWDQALNDAVAGHLREALEHVDAADKIVPRLIDVWRTRERIRKRLMEESHE
jgi:S1-C subfamily serine protease